MPPSTTTTPPTTARPQPLEALRFVDPDEPGGSSEVFGFAYGSFVDPDDVLATIKPVLGAPDQDTGWQPMPPSVECKLGRDYRSIVWDDLRFELEALTSGDVRLAAWSIGDVELSFSPPLAEPIAESSNLTSASGLGIGSPKSAILNEGFGMIGNEDDNRVQALAGIAPIVFELANGSVTAFSIEDNDCYTDNGDM